MSRESELDLRDIAEACAQIRAWTAGMDATSLRADARATVAVERNLLVIGETAKHIHEPPRAKASEVNWREVFGLRDVLAQAWFSVDAEILWSIVKSNLQEIERAVTSMLESRS